MNQFLKEEFARLVGRLPQTDPASPDYHVLLRSLEYLDGMSSTIEAVIALDKVEAEDIAEPIPVPAPVEPPIEKESEPTAPVETPTAEPAVEEEEEIVYSASDVRKALVQAKARGADVKQVLAMFGVDSFQSLPASKYGKVMEAIGGV